MSDALTLGRTLAHGQRRGSLMTGQAGRGAALGPALETLESLSREAAQGVVPITGRQWRRSVMDADLDGCRAAYCAARTPATSALDRHGSGVSRRLRPAVLELAARASDLCGRLEILAALNPGDQAAPRAAEAWRQAIVDDLRIVLFAAIEDAAVPVLSARPSLPDCAAENRDVLLAAFGVPSDELVDDEGSFSDTRLIAAYRLRLPRLQMACDRILTLVAEHPPSVFTAASGARDVVTSASPGLTLWAARDIRSRILDAYAADFERTARILASAWTEMDKESLSFSRLRDRVRRASEATTQRERSIALLEAYKHMAEGLTRRWVAVLLRLTGMDETGPHPTLGTLGESATARLGLLGAPLNSALLPAVRNAEAHEDLDFDEDTGNLVVGDTTVGFAAVLDCLTELDTLQRAWIVGRLAAFADSPELGLAVGRQGTHRPRTADFAFAKERFGHAGQRLRSFTRDRDQLEIVIDRLEADACGPCFLAMTQAAAILHGITRFMVRLPGRDDPVIDLPATALHSNLPVLQLAAANFPDGLPQATFLPCLTWCRLACEPVDEAARVAAWLTLNDAQHAVLDAEANPMAEAPRLRVRLRVVAAAAATTGDLLPRGNHLDVLFRAVRIVENCERALAGGVRSAAVDVLLDNIVRTRDRLGGPPAILPTLDATPLSEAAYPHKMW